MTPPYIVAAAEQKARDNAWPIIAVTSFELLRVLEGNPLNVLTIDGKPARLRLATAQEVLDQQQALAGPGGSLISLPLAEDMVRPISFGCTPVRPADEPTTAVAR